MHTMSKEKKNEKIKEPYQPENTPEPPQRIDPDIERQRENPVEGKRKPAKEADNRETDPEKSHLLNEGADINDETTV